MSVNNPNNRRSISFQALSKDVQVRLQSIRKSVQNNLKQYEEREHKRMAKRSQNKSVAMMQSRELMRDFVRRSRENPFESSQNRGGLKLSVTRGDRTASERQSMNSHSEFRSQNSKSSRVTANGLRMIKLPP